MSQLNNLSNDWNECRNEEEIIMKNTYLNSKAIPFAVKDQSEKNKKRVVWD